MVDVDVDDTTAFLARFADGAVGTFESTRFAAGRRNHNRVEVNGSKGSVYFDLENMNLLEYYNVDDPADVPGFRTIQVNEGCHPYIDHWWPPGHGIGYQNTFVNQFADFFQAIVNDTTAGTGLRSRSGESEGPRGRHAIDRRRAMGRRLVDSRTAPRRIQPRRMPDYGAALPNCDYRSDGR